MTSQTKAELAQKLAGAFVALCGTGFHADRDRFDTMRAVLNEACAALRAEPASEPEQCPMCKGSGQRPVTSFADHSKTSMKSCSICKGRGVLFSHPPSPSALAEVPKGLIAALRWQRQIDADGMEVGVSREAVDTAADILEKLSALPPVAGEAK